MNFPFHALYKCAAFLPLWSRGGNTRSSVCWSPKKPHKNCWGRTQKMSSRPKAFSQKLLGKVTDRLTKGCMWCVLAKRTWNAHCPPWFFSASTSSPMLLQWCTGLEFAAGILVLSLKIFILRIHVYIGLLIQYCNIRWAAETSRGWGIYF